MLQINQLYKSYGSQVLFEGIDLQMNRGERLGLVGRNGHGKSTLFKMILGQESPDSGKITFPKNYKIGHLAQHLHFTQPNLLLEAAMGLPDGEEDHYYKAEAMLFGLGFTEADLERAPSEFSGGYQIRLNLVKLLLSKPNLLLLDEPSNYLDIVSLRWIVRFLNQWRDEIILISHDREFMDSVTTHTASIHRQKLKKVAGGTEKLYNQIAQDEEIYEKTRVNDEKRRKEIESFVNRFRAQATKAAAVQSRIKQLEKMGRKEELSSIENLDFDFHYSPFAAKTVMEVKDLSFAYPNSELLFKNLNFSIKSEDRIAIIGKNGRGKSTLLNVLASELNPNSGEIYSHPEMKLGYFGQTNISRLDSKLTVEEEVGSANSALSRTQVRGICGAMMFEGKQAEKRVAVLSGGEKSRVLLGKILAAPANLLFLDEPTNHLDMQSIDALVESIHSFPGALLMVTHSEMILKQVATKLIVFKESGAELFLGTYEEFLEKWGWEDEGKKSPSKKEVKIQEAKIETVNQNRNDSKEQAKRLKKIEQLELAISEKEKQLSSVQQELEEASVRNEVSAYVNIAAKIKDLQSQIEKHYDELGSLN